MHIDNPDARHIHRSQLVDLQLAGMVVATKQRRTRRPRTYTRASECISYTHEDKSDATIFGSKHNTRATSTPRTIDTQPVDRRPEVLRYNLSTFNLTND